MSDDPGWALPDEPSPVPVTPPQHAQPYPWPPHGAAPPPGRRPMPRWAKIVFGCGIAYYALLVLGVIVAVIAYFAYGRP